MQNKEICLKMSNCYEGNESLLRKIELLEVYKLSKLLLESLNSCQIFNLPRVPLYLGLKFICIFSRLSKCANPISYEMCNSANLFVENKVNIIKAIFAKIYKQLSISPLVKWGYQSEERIIPNRVDFLIITKTIISEYI